MKITGDRNHPHRGAAEPAVARGPYRRGHHRARRDLLLSRTVEEYLHEYVAPRVIGRDPLADRPAVGRSRRLSRLPLHAAPRCAATRPSTSRCGTSSARPPASRSRSCSAASRRAVDPHLQHLRRHRIHQEGHGPDHRQLRPRRQAATMTTSTASCTAPTNWPQ